MHDVYCDMHSELRLPYQTCSCAELRKARAEAYAEGYQEALDVIAAQNAMRLSRKATDTQRAAVKKTLPRSGTKQALLWDLVNAAGDYGLTDDEIEVKTGWTHQSASANRNTLMMKGLLIDSGQRRNNRRGLSCIVWTSVSQSRKDKDVQSPD